MEETQKAKTHLENMVLNAFKCDLIKDLIKEEKTRKTYLIYFFAALLVYLGIAFMLFCIFTTNEAEDILESSKLQGMITFCIFFLALGSPYHVVTAYKKNLKDNLSKKILAIFKTINKNEGKDQENCRLEYGKAGLSYKVISKSNIFGKFTSASTDDCFTGKYKKADFKFAETRLDRSFGKYTSSHQCLLLHIRTRKSFEDDVLIKSKKHIHAFSTILLILFAITSIYFCLMLKSILQYTNCSLHELLEGIALPLGIWLFFIYYYRKFESESNPKIGNILDFENLFKKDYVVMSENKNLAESLATNRLYQEMEKIKQAFNGKSCSCAFYGGENIMFSVETSKNLFEYGSLFKNITSVENFKDIIRQISAIVELVDFVQDEYREYFIKWQMGQDYAIQNKNNA